MWIRNCHATRTFHSHCHTRRRRNTLPSLAGRSGYRRCQAATRGSCFAPGDGSEYWRSCAEMRSGGLPEEGRRLDQPRTRCLCGCCCPRRWQTTDGGRAAAGVDSKKLTRSPHASGPRVASRYAALCGRRQPADPRVLQCSCYPFGRQGVGRPGGG